ncbi:dynein light chain roadblock-type [Cryptococcus wingfieldii CBS 7118]|uniref:Dynein light chain roadblock-type n=1 Tax=Cryptococcus wingfieldii CBS 7118 TaxID=1295528 RepID=A0A1E3HIR5_9TREE|nr:dynein light chain roadblock-type [Cryptococcus wingfieldii CBS 7118]ODN75616.1 dynein light chain roadblock-type [Cryptococcus wingfieldii CBS 7118]
MEAPPEVEATLSRLSQYRNVRGVMVLARAHIVGDTPHPHPHPSRSGDAGIVQTTGTVFEGEGGAKYAGAVERIVLSTGAAIAECEEGDELRLMRIRTKRHELIITPDDKYVLVVLQDPGQ